MLPSVHGQVRLPPLPVGQFGLGPFEHGSPFLWLAPYVPQVLSGMQAPPLQYCPPGQPQVSLAPVHVLVTTAPHGCPWHAVSTQQLPRLVPVTTMPEPLTQYSPCTHGQAMS